MNRIQSRLRIVSTAMLGLMLLGLTTVAGSSSGVVSGAATCPINWDIRGSTTVGPITDLAQPIVTGDGSTMVKYKPGGQWEGSGLGIQGIRGTAASGVNPVDVGQSSRPLNVAEAANIYVYRVARDGMVMAVRDSGTMSFINNITAVQVKQIYESGYTGASWDDYGLGGPNQQIVMRARVTVSGTQPDFLSLFGVSSGLEATTINNSGLPRLIESLDMAEAAAANDYVISYTSLANLFTPNMKALTLDGIAPNQTTVGSQVYPKLRVLHYMTRENTSSSTGTLRIDNSDAVKGDDFINFMFTNLGQSLVDDVGFVEVGASATPPIPDWDINMDGSTSVGDLGAITAKWGQSTACLGWIRADANNSGNISLGDIGVVTGKWGNAGFVPPVYP